MAVCKVSCARQHAGQANGHGTDVINSLLCHMRWMERRQPQLTSPGEITFHHQVLSIFDRLVTQVLIAEKMCEEICITQLATIKLDSTWTALERDATAGRRTRFGQRASAMIATAIAGVLPAAQCLH